MYICVHVAFINHVLCTRTVDCFLIIITRIYSYAIAILAHQTVRQLQSGYIWICMIACMQLLQSLKKNSLAVCYVENYVWQQILQCCEKIPGIS